MLQTGICINKCSKLVSATLKWGFQFAQILQLLIAYTLLQYIVWSCTCFLPPEVTKRSRDEFICQLYRKKETRDDIPPKNRQDYKVGTCTLLTLRIWFPLFWPFSIGFTNFCEVYVSCMMAWCIYYAKAIMGTPSIKTKIPQWYNNTWM